MIVHLKVVLAFIITTVVMCVVNFIAQFVWIFIDEFSGLNSSTGFVITLWFVTGVFTTVFTTATLEGITNMKDIKLDAVGYPIFFVSVIAIVCAVALMINGDFMNDPGEFTLLFSNGFNFISFFVGAGGLGWIARKP